MQIFLTVILIVITIGGTISIVHFFSELLHIFTKR